VGRLAPVKGYPYLLEAMRGVVDEQPESRLAIVGDGPDCGALEAQCRSLGIEKHVVFLGFRTDVPSILRGAQLAAYATLGEGFGLGVVEAMIQETPVVATHTMALPELVSHGGDGFLVPTADPAALRGRMLELIRNPELRASMGRRGRENVEKKFSMQTMIDKTAALYRELLVGKH
jgi:glycosyltransferase involved in cell wall biosynthesis